MAASNPLPISAVPGFDYQPRTRVVFGPGAIEKIGQYAQELNVSRVLLVTDAGLVKVGHAGRVQRLLESSGLEVACFDRVQENPSTRCVDDCLAVARQARSEAIIGLGGGSSLDTAKGCNFLLTNGGEMRDYWGIGKAKLPMLPLIAVPTTGGTGSECQSFALISDEKTHQKMACGDPKAAARLALLDPALTLSQPPRVTACTGIDAVAHAVESAVTRKRSALSLVFSREAFKLTATGLPKVLAAPLDLEARGRMLLGAAWAGTAIENSMLGAAHSAANPLTAHFNTIHGHAVGLMLPHVVRFNAQEPGAAAIYADLAQAAHLAEPGEDPVRAAGKLADDLTQLLQQANLPTSLQSVGLSTAALPGLAAEAAAQWTAQFNPRPITAADFETLYREAL